MKFELSVIQRLRAKSWMSLHRLTCRDSNFSYIFSPKKNIVRVEVKCNQCSEPKDLTEYERS